ncbi:hypothetical protein K490DRAFT_65141 [Saccharata proteae CBS 121410]|uniref:Uncharacterized protein n=1 Tax=Saccharata proteae CBS 121410 TaxID=1314787 RepID=A0A9P4HW13_9PEZI|nr:hypothetical protein K490DRAFT_65141 [Saccharata proteae CBS 121410]
MVLQWFSTVPTFEGGDGQGGGNNGLQLDIVGFLAILGEGSVLANAQVSTLSKWIFLPRLLPAPQALLRPTRPSKLEPTPGRVTGVVSGNDRDYLNHIGHIVLDADSMKEFDVRVVKVKRNDAVVPVKARTLSYLTINAVLGCAFSTAILILSIIWRDGMALIACLSLSSLSTIIGLGNKWTLRLPKRRTTNGSVPRGDVVIRYPKGSFLIVQCDEDVAREIFFAPENIEYLISHQPVYRILSLVGSMLLMAGVITLANAQVKSQTCFAAAYMILNATYWIVAAFPAKVHWNTEAFIVEKRRFSTSDEDDKNHTDHNSSFTKALWKVIVATKSTGWVRRGDAAPDTEVWKAWLCDALEAARTAMVKPDQVTGIQTYHVPDWDPTAELGKFLQDKTLNPDTPEYRARQQV